MIIAAIDVSHRSKYVDDYDVTIYNILSSLKFPLRIIQWSECIREDEIYNRLEDYFYLKNGTSRVPKSFIKRLPDDQTFELYLFTNGKIDDKDVKECQYFLKKRNLNISQIHLHYIGNINEINLKFTDVFYGYPQIIYFNGEYKATIDPNLNLEDVDYDYIMKDDSLKATILTKINSPEVDNYHLKNEFILLTKRISEEYFKKKINKNYAQRDVQSCTSFNKRHLYDSDKEKFQKKTSEIFKLFKKYVDTYSLKHFETQTEKYNLQCKNADKVKTETQTVKNNLQGENTDEKERKNETFSEIMYDKTIYPTTLSYLLSKAYI